MASRVRLNPDGGAGARVWVGLAGLLAAGSLLAWWLPTPWLDWEPERAASEPWRAWSAAFVHWSPLHLAGNLLASAVVAALGWSAGVPRRIALAWFAAWPLTQLGLLLRPELAHYGGLSGVMHAGVAAAALWLVLVARGVRRGVGAALLAGLAVKVILELPWGPVLRPMGGGLDIAVAPLAHATGVVAGVACALLAWASSAPESGR